MGPAHPKPEPTSHRLVTLHLNLHGNLIRDASSLPCLNTLLHLTVDLGDNRMGNSGACNLVRGLNEQAQQLRRLTLRLGPGLGVRVPTPQTREGLCVPIPFCAPCNRGGTWFTSTSA